MQREVENDGEDRNEVEPGDISPAASEKVDDVIKYEKLSHVGQHHVQPPPPPQGKGEEVEEEGGENRDPLDSVGLVSC